MKVKVRPKLNKILKERNMRQYQLSELSGVPQGSISRFDGNSRHHDSHMFSIARALELNVEDLFEVKEDE
jgi:predicted XRE-type DNA-binding protein